MDNVKEETSTIQESIERDGFALVPEALNEKAVTRLIAVLEEHSTEKQATRGLAVYALRNLLDIPEIQELSRSESLRGLITPILGLDCFAVRGLLFDKLPEANWKVPWHQDLSIAVQSRVEAEGFGPWTIKEGVPHVQPPVAILEKMLTLRLHLDDCPQSNGALRVLPGSHRLGRLTAEQIQNLVSETQPVICEAPRGGVLLMRPLLLHASSPSQEPGHRRVIHLEYAAHPLPGGLQWHRQ